MKKTPDSEFTEAVCTMRGEFAGSSTNGNGDKKVSFYVDRQSRLAAEEVADLAGLIVEIRVTRKPRSVRAPRHDGHMDLPPAPVPE